MIAKQVQLAFERSFGMACFFAYFVLMLFKHTYILFENHPFIVAAFGFVFVGSYVAIAFLADIFDKIGPATLSIAATVLCIIGLAMLDLPFFVPIKAAGGILAVVGCVIFTIIWGKNLSFYSHQDRLAILPATFLLGAVIVALVFALNDIMMIVVTSCLPLISALHLRTLRPQRHTFSFTDLKTSRKDYRFQLSVLLTTGLTGFCWGVGFLLVMRYPDPSLVIPLCFSIPVIIGCIILFLDISYTKKISEENLLRHFAIASIIPIALLPFIPDWAQLLCGAFFVMYFTINTMMNISAIAETARFNQISPYWVYGASLAYYFAGASISFFLFDWAFRQGGPAAQIAVCLGTVFLIVWSSDFIFQDNYPGKEQAIDAIETNKSLARNEKRPALWQKKIDFIIAKYDLTARQKEVFRMLVRGRNAQFIAQEFFISYSTAKAHIHNIYSKLDIHSQQELIDLVENAPVEPDAEPPRIEDVTPPPDAAPPGVSDRKRRRDTMPMA